MELTIGLIKREMRKSEKQLDLLHYTDSVMEKDHLVGRIRAYRDLIRLTTTDNGPELLAEPNDC